MSGDYVRALLLAERHTLTRVGNLVQIFDPEPAALQREVLTLLGVDARAFSA